MVSDTNVLGEIMKNLILIGLDATLSVMTRNYRKLRYQLVKPYMASKLVELLSIYSSSVELNETIAYFMSNQDIVPDPKLKQNLSCISYLVRINKSMEHQLTISHLTQAIMKYAFEDQNTYFITI
jgi:hypothetical protein